MPECGSQVVLCDLPIRFDTYKGCSHDCKYCFVQRKKDLKDIEKGETAIALKNFISGQRNKVCNWCDWDIPIHWGGMSDPFQPAEKIHKLSYECLKVFAKTQYPFVVSTKGKLIINEEYLTLLRKCNCVVQISMICNKYDVLEKGAPTYDERLEMVKILSRNVRRVNVRIQPYMTQVFKDVKDNMKRLADAGAYGVIVEGMKFAKKKKGLVKIGADYVYPKEVLKQHFEQLKEEAHKVGLKFYSGENRLRAMGDDMCCCGIDGMKDFKGNSYNLCHILNNKYYEITETMKQCDTAECFSSLYQSTLGREKLRGRNFADFMKEEYKNKTDVYDEIFGKK